MMIKDLVIIKNCSGLFYTDNQRDTILRILISTVDNATKNSLLMDIDSKIKDFKYSSKNIQKYDQSCQYQIDKLAGNYCCLKINCKET